MIAPVRQWRMGREEEIRYAREHGIPVKGGTEIVPYSIDDNLWGRSSEGRWIEELDHAPEDDVFQLVTRPEQAPDEAELLSVSIRGGRPGGAERRAARAGRPDRAAAGSWRPPRRRDRRSHRGPNRRPEGPRHLRGARRDDPAARPPGARTACGTIHQNQLKPMLDQRWAYLVYAGLWLEPLREDLDAYMDAANQQVTGTIGLKLYKGSVRVVTPRVRRTRSTTSSSPGSRSRAVCSRRPPHPGSSSCGRCSRGWPGG